METFFKDKAISPAALLSFAAEYSEANGIPNSLLNTEIACEGIIPSTNDLAKELCKKTKGNMLITAEGQTGGRGRMGRSFFSPQSTGAYFTIVLHGERSLLDSLKLTPLAAVAVCRAIEALSTLTPKIKWVNDIYLDEKKVCGILTEAVTLGDAVTDIIVGIGINLTTECFPKDIPIAGSLNINTLTPAKIIAAVALEFLKEVPYIAQNKHIAYYKSHSLVLGKEIVYYQNNEQFFGTAVDITEDGGLMVRTVSGELLTLNGGEITLRLK